MSADHDRPRRPQLDRREPQRNWSGMFGGAEPAGDRRDGEAGTDAGRDDRGSLGDAISRSVDLGYRVVDEYIRQGQRAAQRFGDRSMAPESVVGDLRDSSDRMSQYASDFLGLWFEFMEVTSGNGTRAGEGRPAAAAGLRSRGWVAPAPRAPESAPAGEAVAQAALVRVQIEMQTVQPTEVTLDLRADVAGRSLTVHGLRAGDAAKPRMIDVEFCAGSEREPTRLRVRVPPQQPAGTYSGLIIDEHTSMPVGTVTVRVTSADE